MEGEPSSTAGPSSIATDAAVSSVAPASENGTAPAPALPASEPEGAAASATSASTTTAAAEAPAEAASIAATPSNGTTEQDHGEMAIDPASPANLPKLPAHLTLEDPATAAVASTSGASSSSNNAASTNLPTPTTLEPPMSAPPAPSSSSEGRTKASRAAKIKANAMVVSLGSDGLEGSLSASEGPGTPVMPNTAPLSRAKRARNNVKFSPVKGPKATGRRAAAAVAAGNIAATGKALAAAAELDDGQLPNNDYCETCGGKGHFLCCDGCPRSFHFTCLDPPLDLDEVPTESWYCKVCEAARKLPIPPRGLLGPLVMKVESENPTCFELPAHVKNSFKNVTTGQYGEYVDTNEFRPLSGLGKAGKGGYEERDPYKVKDRQGRTVLCHRCREPASQAKHKRIVACDFCEYHWHLDCIDPPLVGMPAVTRRFMCPAHADEAVPHRRKALKHQKLIKVKEPHTRNNGDIEIVPIEGRFTNVKHAPEEIVSQGLRYQVPEQVVIADFWTKLRRDRYGQPLETASTRGETPQTSETFDFSDSSSLTSMEASPEPQSTELPEVTSNGNAEADGAELLWLFAQQQSAREGTEVSDGDPPDIGAWQAETEATSRKESNEMDVDNAAAPASQASNAITEALSETS
ncbi:hypothetical protein P389DRAFT_82470 [Cystobasidium minutum MCA 4210]|uniref:uncharacterized protein n=1 Tax=Cystobasidium minutum MCA 4210 TaxID=1397322 RepID=UPI0034CF290B|eukprot:jgi/Rhomi1/82470/CE82469_876